MKVGVFFPQENMEHIRMLTSFAMGLHRQGVDTLALDVNKYEPVDVAVVFGVGKRDVPASWARGEIIRRQRAKRRNVIIIEKGFVHRDEYYMVGVNGLNNRANFFNSNSPADRWNELGIELRPWRIVGEHVIVCCQVPSDASVQDVDIVEWSADTVTYLRKRVKRRILFRPHPLARDRTPNILGAINSTAPLDKDLQDAWAVVTYNSNVAVDAILQGIPAFAMDEGSMAWDVAGHDLQYVNHPRLVTEKQRLQWAHNLAYTQWNEEEFEQGLPWAHLQKGLWGRTE